MKRAILITFLLFVCITDLISQTQYAYLVDALAKIKERSLELSDYTFADGGNIYGVFLSSGESESFYYTFSSGITYKIIGYADIDVYDLDLYLYSSDNVEIVRDSQRNNTHELDFTPSYTGQRTVKILNYSSAAPSFCVIAIMKKGYDYFDHKEKFRQAAYGLALVSMYANTYDLYFTSGFCLFGSYLASGTSDWFANYQVPSSGNYVYFASASDNCSDADVYIYNNDDNSLLYQDTKSEKFAGVPCYLSQYSVYKLLYRNYSSNGNAFIISAIMKR